LRPQSIEPEPRVAPRADAAVAPAAPEPGLATGLARGLGALSNGLDRLADCVVLFRYRGWVFVTFGFFSALGVFVTGAWMGAIAIGRGLDPAHYAVALPATTSLIVLGSWLVAQLYDYRLVLRNPGLALRRPVFVSWGGIAALPASLAAIAWLTGFSLWLLLDALSCALLAGHMLGRFGCLSYGCCYGRPTRGRLAITYRSPLAKAVRMGGLGDVPLHPVALYEAALDLAVLVAVNVAVARGAAVGVATGLIMLGYGLGRFALEFWKNNDGRIVIGRLSINHLLCLGLGALSVLVLWTALRAGVPAPPIDWAASLAAAPLVLPPLVAAAAIVFVGFALHRGRVGAW
jgi:phosphatidylglycerol:prolipoprotein diacylglycerol transferase